MSNLKTTNNKKSLLLYEKKKLSEAKKLKEQIAKLDELEMYSIYQILENNLVNITNNMNGIYFDLLSLEDDIFKIINKFVEQTLYRKNLYNKS